MSLCSKLKCTRQSGSQNLHVGPEAAYREGIHEICPLALNGWRRFQKQRGGRRWTRHMQSQGSLATGEGLEVLPVVSIGGQYEFARGFWDRYRWIPFQKVYRQQLLTIQRWTPQQRTWPIYLDWGAGVWTSKKSVTTQLQRPASKKQVGNTCHCHPLPYAGGLCH